jgi:hypothetical protein
MEAQPFYKKQERVVKWVMSFVLFRIPAPPFISFFFFYSVPLELSSPVYFLFFLLSFQIAINVESAELEPDG